MFVLRLKSYFTSNVYVSSLFSVPCFGNDVAEVVIKNCKFGLINLSLFHFLKAAMYYKWC